MTTKTDNQQLAFHAWLSRRGIASNYQGDGQYEEPRVQLAWEAWTTAVDEMRPRAAACTKAAVFNAEMGMKFGDDSPEERTYHAACNEADRLTDQINALKSDAKGGV